MVSSFSTLTFQLEIPEGFLQFEDIHLDHVLAFDSKFVPQ